MSQTPFILSDIDDDNEETAALSAAVAEAMADPRPSVPHAIVRKWLLELVAGNLHAKPPMP